MDYADYDLSISDEQREMRDAAHRFAAEVMRPAGIALDRLPADEVVAPASALYDVLRQAADLGYTRLRAPVAVGGLETPPLTSYLVYEELAWGNLGLAAVIFLAATHADVALLSGDSEVMGEFALPYYACTDGSVRGCWAITEPDHGSDWLAAIRPEMQVKARAQVQARADGDEWVLNGQKSAWVSNGPLATHAMLNVHLDPKGSMAQSGVCVLPLDLAGISRGRPLEKHGVRTLPQGELFFEEVRIPRRWMVVQPDSYVGYMHNHLAGFNAGVGCVATGLARAAYECALTYTKERVQGGKPIVEHQSVKARLFRMFALVQAARSLSRDAYLSAVGHILAGEQARVEYSISSKVFCTQAALEVATLAVQLLGGNGMTREYPAEMFLRDAAALTIADGENHLLSQVGAGLL
jgi:alkylation response protein AidB-like acyl-CoA dehydrogenase